MLVRRGRFGQLAGLIVDIIMALPRPINAIGPMQAGVEPLRRIWCNHLLCQHVAQFVKESLGMVFVLEIAALPAPISPCPGEAIKHLRGGHFRNKTLFFRQQRQRRLIGNRTPEEGRHVVFFNALQLRWHPGFAEIFLRQNVGGNLAPHLRHINAIKAEHHRPIRITDFALGFTESNAGVRRLPRLGIKPIDFHVLSSRVQPHECWLFFRAIVN